MVATHSIKVNGQWYKAGEEIAPAPVIKEPVIEKPEKPKYTRKDITFMRVDDLRKLAEEQGIKDADEMTGTALKPLLIEKLGL